jgi:hypothetical protein
VFFVSVIVVVVVVSSQAIGWIGFCFFSLSVWARVRFDYDFIIEIRQASKECIPLRKIPIGLSDWTSVCGPIFFWVVIDAMDPGGKILYISFPPIPTTGPNSRERPGNGLTVLFLLIAHAEGGRSSFCRESAIPILVAPSYLFYGSIVFQTLLCTLVFGNDKPHRCPVLVSRSFLCGVFTQSSRPTLKKTNNHQSSLFRTTTRFVHHDV